MRTSVAILFAALVMPTFAAQRPARHGAAGPSASLGSSGASLARAVNRARLARGLRPLTIDPVLTRAARAHGRDLLANNAFTHDFIRNGRDYPFSTWIAWYYRRSCAGENLAEGEPTLTAASAVRLWLQSPGHRANMLSSAYRTMGVALTSMNGMAIAVNLFGDCTHEPR